jgi:hypothetical protein
MAKTATYALIDSTTGTGSSSSITFNSIPNTYTDLILVVNGATTSSTGNPCLRFNGDTGSNYARTNMGGSGTVPYADSETNANRILLIGSVYFNSTLNTNLIVQIQDYSNTTTFKSTLARANKATDGVDANVGLWRNTAAINSLTLFTASGLNISSASTFKLYGIQAGNA